MDKPIRIKLLSKLSDDRRTDIFIYKEGEGMCCNGEIEITQGCSDERNTIRFKEGEVRRLIKSLQGKIPELTESNQKIFPKDMEVYLMKKGSYNVYTPAYFGLKDEDFE